MSTIQKGNAAEATVLGTFIDLGLHVLIPFGSGHPFDLVVHLGARNFLRVQCKCSRVVGGCIRFNAYSTDHGKGQGSYVGLADLFGVYCPANGGVYLVPVDEAPRNDAFLRVEPARNNQHCGVRMAADYEAARWTEQSLREVLYRARP